MLDNAAEPVSQRDKCAIDACNDDVATATTSCQVDESHQWARSCVRPTIVLDLNDIKSSTYDLIFSHSCLMFILSPMRTTCKQRTCQNRTRPDFDVGRYIHFCTLCSLSEGFIR